MKLPYGFYIYDIKTDYVIGDRDFWYGTNFNVFASVEKTGNDKKDKEELIKQFYAKNPEYIKND